MLLEHAWQLLKATWVAWQKDKASVWGAALAYYTVFSLAPLLVIAVAIAGWGFGDEAARGELSKQLAGMLGEQGAAAVETMIQSAAREKSSGIAASIIGFGALLLGASGVFKQLKDALNTIWDVPPRAGSGLVSLVIKQFLSFAMVLGMGFLLLVSLIASSLLGAASGWIEQMMPIPPILLEAGHVVVSFVLFTLFFAAIFKILPDTYVEWRDVWVGALMTSVLFGLGKFLIGLYLGHSAVGSTYGAAGSLVVVLVWTYYSSQILLFGAEFTQAYACRHGSRRAPVEGQPLVVASGSHTERL